MQPTQAGLENAFRWLAILHKAFSLRKWQSEKQGEASCWHSNVVNICPI